MNSESELRQALQAYDKARGSQRRQFPVDEESLARLRLRLESQVAQTRSAQVKMSATSGVARLIEEWRAHWRLITSVVGAATALLCLGLFLALWPSSHIQGLATLPLTSVGVIRSTDPSALDRLVPTNNWPVSPDFRTKTLNLPLTDGTTLIGKLTPAPDLEAGSNERRVFRVSAQGRTREGSEISATGVFEIRSSRWQPGSRSGTPETADIEFARLTLDLQVPGKPGVAIWSELRVPQK